MAFSSKLFLLGKIVGKRPIFSLKGKCFIIIYYLKSGKIDGKIKYQLPLILLLEFELQSIFIFYITS